jgi:hypothetical protein
MNHVHTGDEKEIKYEHNVLLPFGVISEVEYFEPDGSNVSGARHYAPSVAREPQPVSEQEREELEGKEEAKIAKEKQEAKKAQHEILEVF